MKTLLLSLLVLTDSTSVNVTSADYYTHYHHRELMITSPHASDMASVLLPMDPNTELTHFEYELRDASGQVLVRLKKRDLQRTDYSSDMATDYYRLWAEVTPPSFPVTVSYSYQMGRRGNVVSYPEFSPQDHYEQEVVHSVYQIRWHPDKVQLRQRALHLQPQQPVTLPDGKQQLTYRLDHLQPLHDYPFGRQLREAAPRVWFAPERFTYFDTHGSMHSWQQLGTWLHDLTHDRDWVSDQLRQRVHQLTDTCPDPLSQVQALYRYLDQSTRYVSLQFGIGGYQPASAVQTEMIGYGDCKGLSQYMHSLLQVIGIPSRLLVIDTNHSELLDDFASLQQANHMILEVLLPGPHSPSVPDTLWLECTNPSLPLGFRHRHIAGHRALELSPQGGRLVRVPSYADSLNLTATQLQVRVMDDASARFTRTTRYHCLRYDDHCALLHLTGDDLIQALQGYLPPRAVLGTAEVTDLSQPAADPCLEVALEASHSRFANRTGRRLFIPANPLHDTFRPIPDTALGDEPLLIRQGFSQDETIQIELPAAYPDVESLPAAIQITEPFGTFSQQVTLQGQVVTVTSHYALYSGTYPSTSRPALQAMQKAMQKGYGDKIVVKQ